LTGINSESVVFDLFNANRFYLTIDYPMKWNMKYHCLGPFETI